MKLLHNIFYMILSFKLQIKTLNITCEGYFTPLHRELPI
jgi:hypothetical protein